MSKKFDLGDYATHYSKIMDNNKESKSKIFYYIDEEKRTIVAIMRECEYDAIDVLQKMGIRNIYHDGYRMDKFMMNPIYRGKAKCSPEDEWDEEYGMKLARNRMLANYYRAQSMALMRAEKVLQGIVEEIGSRIDYADYRFDKTLSNQL